ncbi:MAG: cell division protein FtsZ [Clostridia bacterium]|nr:cell division protein FtsZ [Clostridia bacterium]
MTFAHDDAFEYGVNIKVVGVGGGGNNAINRMIASGVKGVDFIAINTDKQALKKCTAPNQLVIGEKITNGFGAGSNPEIGERAAEEAVNEIKKLLSGADMAFITAGMGGGTGTGAAPVVARIANEMDILTVGVVTTPFKFEGGRKMDRAQEGIAEIAQYVDSLVVIPNERLKMVTDTRITLVNAFTEADEVLRRAVQSISDLINIPGFINIDFADVTSIIAHSGVAYMGMGSATGKDKAKIAANMAISSPLLETSIKGAKGVIISISASADVGLEDVDLASTMISESCNPDASVIWGVAFDPNLEDEMRITIVAAGFDQEGETLDVEALEEAAEDVAEEAPKKSGDAIDDFFDNL